MKLKLKIIIIIAIFLNIGLISAFPVYRTGCRKLGQACVSAPDRNGCLTSGNRYVTPLLFKFAFKSYTVNYRDLGPNIKCYRQTKTLNLN